MRGFWSCLRKQEAHVGCREVVEGGCWLQHRWVQRGICSRCCVRVRVVDEACMRAGTTALFGAWRQPVVQEGVALAHRGKVPCLGLQRSQLREAGGGTTQQQQQQQQQQRRRQRQRQQQQQQQQQRRPQSAMGGTR